jgi:glyoxylase-like metal-dependent hydrolase (beta-lactamase superfamily II)
VYLSPGYNQMLNEAELNELGIFRIPIPIPFAQAGGPVNACIIEEEDGVLLFDPGLGTDAGQAALAEGFARTGHRFQQVNRVILSHGHIDHFGATAWLLEQIGREIPVAVHEADASRVLQSGPDWSTLLLQNSRYLQWLGMPSTVLEDAAQNLTERPSLGRRLARVIPLSPGERFKCKHVNLEVMHTPGHTRGLCCLYESTHKILFSGDHFLERVSPNPTIDFQADGATPSFKPLITYFESIERIRALPINLVIPGHASPFNHHLKVIDSLHAFYERRQARILEILGAKNLSVYEVMRELFMGGEGFELILMMSEALGNLEVLETKGKVQRETTGKIVQFHV